MALEQEVIDIVVEQLGVDKEDVELSKSFVEDLNADSLDLTELIMTLEERFDCEISEEQAEKLKTVGDVIAYLDAFTSTTCGFICATPCALQSDRTNPHTSLQNINIDNRPRCTSQHGRCSRYSR